MRIGDQSALTRPTGVSPGGFVVLGGGSRSEHEAEDDSDDDQARHGVRDDPDPGASKALRRVGLIGEAVDHAGRDAPWLVQVVDPEENAVGHAVSFPEHRSHAWQQQPPEEQFLDDRGQEGYGREQRKTLVARYGLRWSPDDRGVGGLCCLDRALGPTIPAS